MKELLTRAWKLDVKGLLVTPTRDTSIQAFRALFVGALALTADAGVLYLLSLTGRHYLLCAAFGFAAGVAVNYILSVNFVFSEKARIGRAGEITLYIVLSLIGLGLTGILMWCLTEVIGLYFMVSKGIAAVIVFAWNFGARKVLLYRKAHA